MTHRENCPFSLLLTSSSSRHPVYIRAGSFSQMKQKLNYVYCYFITGFRWSGGSIHSTMWFIRLETKPSIHPGTIISTIHNFFAFTCCLLIVCPAGLIQRANMQTISVIRNSIGVVVKKGGKE